MTHALDEVTRDRQDDTEITIRLDCGGILTLYTDKDGLHVDLQEGTTALENPRLATSKSDYAGGLMLFVHGQIPTQPMPVKS